MTLADALLVWLGLRPREQHESTPGDELPAAEAGATGSAGAAQARDGADEEQAATT
ncbi:hypothetical protein ACFZB2_37545 [Streptomyces bobili]|uniref:hypothetical protein n=1 Tax=Streptomyces bobili TaxID=67280 RepID=UPI0036E33E66